MSVPHDSTLYLQAARRALSEALGDNLRVSTKRPRGAFILAVRGLRPFLPYVIHPTHIGHLWLNRDYKPLGVAVGVDGGWVRYEDFPSHRVIALEATVAAVSMKRLVSQFRDLEGDTFYLFDDATAPWDSVHDARKLLDKLDAALALAQAHPAPAPVGTHALAQMP